MLNPISGNYAIPKAFVFARFEGQSHFEELGDTDGVEVNVEVERDDRYDNRFGTRRVADSQITSINATLSMTLAQMTGRNRALGVMGSKGSQLQTAATAQTVTFTVAAGQEMQAFDIGKLDLANVSVSDGGGTAVLGTDYFLDAAAGLIQFKDVGTYTVTFDCAAITAASNRLKTGIGGNPNLVAEIIIRGTNDNGEKSLVRLWKVRLAPSGARGYVSESERGTIQVEGTLQADAARAAAEGDVNEFAFGYETTLAA